jgi:hypothetical protein
MTYQTTFNENWSIFSKLKGRIQRQHGDFLHLFNFFKKLKYANEKSEVIRPCTEWDSTLQPK